MDQRPLESICIVDVTEGAQGPLGASFLADLGAVVVKVERPEGELMRTTGPTKWGVGLPLSAMSRGRVASLALDLKDSDDRTELLALVRTADIFMQNWRPGVAESLQLDYTTLVALNPRLIYAAASGFGQTGPMATQGSMDQIASAAGGLSSVSGYRGEPTERARISLVDFLSAFVVAEMILAALLRRELSGGPQYVETSQLEAAVTAVSAVHEAYRRGGEAAATPRGSADFWVCPSGMFRCADGEFVALEAATDEQWRRIVDAFEIAVAPAWATAQGRLADEEKVNAQVAIALGDFTSGDVLTRAVGGGVPATLVRRSALEAMSDHRLSDLHVSWRMSQRAGWVGLPRSPWEYPDLDVRPGAPCPPLGTANEEDWRERWNRSARAATTTRQSEPPA